MSKFFASSWQKKQNWNILSGFVTKDFVAKNQKHTHTRTQKKGNFGFWGKLNMLITDSLSIRVPLYTRSQGQCSTQIKLLINAELYGIVLAPKAEKKKRIPSNLGSQFATLDANVLTFIDILTSMFLHFCYLTWGQPNNKPKNAQSWPQVFSGLVPSVKWALIITSKNWKKKTLVRGLLLWYSACPFINQSINLVTITEERLFTTKKITKRKMFKRKCS